MIVNIGSRLFLNHDLSLGYSFV